MLIAHYILKEGIKMRKRLEVRKKQFAENSSKLLEALAQNRGLSYIVDMGYEMIGNPFCIIDMSGKAIATISSGKTKDDPVWNQVITPPGYLTFDTFSFYTANKFYEKIASNKSAFFWVDDYSKYPRIVGKIKIGSKHIATLVVCEHEKPYKEGDIELISLLCDVFSIELQKNEFTHYSRGLVYESFFEDLLKGKVKDNRVIQERMKILNLKFEKNLFVLTIDINDFTVTNSPTSFSYVQRDLEKIIKNGKTVMYYDSIVMIVSCDNQKSFFKTDLQVLKKFLKKNNMCAGLSCCFSNIEEIREYYLQSIEALKLGTNMNKEAVFFTYEEYAVFHMADICSNVIDLKKVCHPSLLLLIEYDRQNNTEYTQNLYAYIINLKNIVKSSEYLHIHRNSLAYRIQKIENIMNIDLSDNNVLFYLHLSFKLLEFMKETF